MPGPRPVRAPRGPERSCKGWGQEAALRMLMNNLDPEVAEHPDDLVVYGGTGRAARSWDAFDAIVRTLRELEDDETLLVQSGKPVGVFRTHAWAPRVLLANSNLVPDWATWEEFRRLEALGLTMYGQMTAGSWIYIGTQGILQGTYETFAAVAARRGGTLAGTITLTAGLGGMGGAQPLAVTMNDGVAICVDCDPTRVARRLEHRYLDVQAADVDEALRLAVEARDARRPLSIGVVGNAAEVFPALLAAGAPIDVVTDQTSAHDPLSYLPVGIAFEDLRAMAEKDPVAFTDAARASMARHVEAMVGFRDAGAEVFDYGNSIRDEARKGGFARAFEVPGFVPEYIRPQFAEGRGPFRWAALSGDPADIAATDRAVLELFPDDERLARWLRMAGRAGGLPGAARPDLLARLRRAAPRRAALQRDGRERRAVGAGGHRARPPRLRLGRVAVPRDRGHAGRLGRHRRLAAAQRPAQHRPPGPPGSRSTPAAASGWAARCTPGRSSSPTARRWPPRSWPACCSTTRAPASSGTPTPATSGRSRWRRERGVRLPSRARELRRRCGPSSRRSAATRAPAATTGARSPTSTPSCGRGSSARRRPAGSTCGPTATAGCGPGGASRGPARSSPAATSTACRAAARTTARSAWCPRCSRSTTCGRAASCRPGRSPSSCSPRRRAPGSASPASAAG